MRKRFLFVILFSVFFFLPAYCTHAFSIEPTKQTISIDPGVEATVFVTVLNSEKKVITVEPDIDSFSVDSATGLSEFGIQDDAEDWVHATPKSATLSPGEQQVFAYTITVPKNAVPGAHYLGLFAKSTSTNGTVEAQSRVGSLLFLYVAGEIRESLLRDTFFSGRSYFFGQTPTIFLQLTNNGNIHVVPQGELVAIDMFGKEVWRGPVNEKNIKVFPRETFERTIQLESLPKTVFGLVYVSLHVRYGLTEQVFTMGTSFWLIPFFMVYLVGGGVILLFVFFKIKKRFV